MKIKLEQMLLGAAIVFIYMHFFNPSDSPIPVETVVVSEAVKGKEEKELAEVTPDTIYIDRWHKPKKLVVVDSTYKALYDAAVLSNDSITMRNLFLESIILQTTNEILVDNAELKVSGTFTTRGTLVDYSILYEIKPKTFSYTPKVHTELPKLSLIAGIELGLPTEPFVDPLISINAGFMVKSGYVYTIGYDSQQRVTLGLSKAFKLF